MSLSSTLPAWLAGDAIHGGSGHLTRMACEEEVHEFFEHVTRITDPDYGLGNCCDLLSVVSGIPNFSRIIHYLPSKMLVCVNPLGIAGRLRVMGPGW